MNKPKRQLEVNYKNARERLRWYIRASNLRHSEVAKKMGWSPSELTNFLGREGNVYDVTVKRVAALLNK